MFFSHVSTETRFLLRSKRGWSPSSGSNFVLEMAVVHKPRNYDYAEGNAALLEACSFSSAAPLAEPWRRMRCL